MATEYSTMKVPELKKLLQERNLSASGNKADLIARLVDADKDTQQSPLAVADEIDYSDGDNVVNASQPTVEAVQPLTNDNELADAVVEDVDDVAATEAPEVKEIEEVSNNDDTTTTEVSAMKNKERTTNSIMPLNLQPTDASEEARKREERAKRFGIPEDDEQRKLVERAARFGTLPVALDDALPDGSAAKKFNGSGSGAGSRQHRHNNNGSNRHQGRNNHRHNNNRRRRDSHQSRQGHPNRVLKRVLEDPAERSKAEARQKRFATAQ